VADLDEGRGGVLDALALYEPYGWMARIGLIVPASNTVNAHEWGMMLPDGISLHIARAAQSGRSSRDSFARMAEAAERAAMDLRPAAIDILAYGCTSGSFVTLGPAEMSARLEAAAGCRATNSAESVVAALRHLGLARVAMATPYLPYINEAEIAFLAAEGITVTSAIGLGLGRSEQERFLIPRLPPETVFRMARAVDRPDAEAIFISCTNLPTARLIGAIEDQQGKPVVTSN
jgi:maleate cis-trans isomerase